MSTLCPSVSLVILLSIHPFKHSSNGYYIISFWQSERESSRNMYSLCLLFSGKHLFGKGPGSRGAIFIPDHNFTKIYLEIYGWPKGPRHHPSCQRVSFFATFLPALFNSYVRNVRSSGFFSDVVFNSLSSVASFTCFPSTFLRVPALTSLHSLCNFTAEMYLLFFILCNICIGYQIMHIIIWCWVVLHA